MAFKREIEQNRKDYECHVRRMIGEDLIKKGTFFIEQDSFEHVYLSFTTDKGEISFFLYITSRYSHNGAWSAKWEWNICSSNLEDCSALSANEAREEILDRLNTFLNPPKRSRRRE